MRVLQWMADRRALLRLWRTDLISAGRRPVRRVQCHKPELVVAADANACRVAQPASGFAMNALDYARDVARRIEAHRCWHLWDMAEPTRVRPLTYYCRFEFQFPTFGPFRSTYFRIVLPGFFLEYHENNLELLCGRFVSGCRMGIFNPRQSREELEALRLLWSFDTTRIVGYREDADVSL